MCEVTSFGLLLTCVSVLVFPFFPFCPAEYSSCKATDAHIGYFWEPLQEMSQDERRAFLVFSWAQQVCNNTEQEREAQGTIVQV